MFNIKRGISINIQMDERKRKRERKKIIQDEEQQPTSKIEGRELEESQRFQY